MVYHVMLRGIIVSEDTIRIANALERIASALEQGAHITIDHGAERLFIQIKLVNGE